MDAKNEIKDIKPHHPQRQDQSLYQRPDVYQGRRSLHTRIYLRRKKSSGTRSLKRLRRATTSQLYSNTSIVYYQSKFCKAD